MNAFIVGGVLRSGVINRSIGGSYWRILNIRSGSDFQFQRANIVRARFRRRSFPRGMPCCM
jgi:hypothetical protein